MPDRAFWAHSVCRGEMSTLAGELVRDALKGDVLRMGDWPGKGVPRGPDWLGKKECWERLEVRDGEDMDRGEVLGTWLEIVLLTVVIVRLGEGTALDSLTNSWGVGKKEGEVEAAKLRACDGSVEEPMSPSAEKLWLGGRGGTDSSAFSLTSDEIEGNFSLTSDWMEGNFSLTSDGMEGNFSLTSAGMGGNFSLTSDGMEGNRGGSLLGSTSGGVNRLSLSSLTGGREVFCPSFPSFPEKVSLFFPSLFWERLSCSADARPEPLRLFKGWAGSVDFKDCFSFCSSMSSS